MKKSDVFVLYDGVQFSDGFYQHRNRVRTQNGWIWLTIPVERKMKPIHTIKLKNDVLLSRKPWREYHWDIIKNSYQKTPYFETYRKNFEEIFLEKKYTHLSEFTIDIIELLAQIAGISTKIIKHSCLDIEAGNASERLAVITKTLGGSVYLSGPSGGTKYELNEDDFSRRDIAVAYQKFHHPHYPQYHARFDGKFEKNLAAIDALFNVGTLSV